MKPSTQLLQAIAVTAELTRTQLSEIAARVMAEDLSGYPEAQVLKALVRCRRELKGQLTIKDVLDRLDDGRPGPEEAWAMLPRNDNDTVVWTEEMAEAWGVAKPLLDEGDTVQARMAFKEVYVTAVQRARDERRPVKWLASLGRDPLLRDQVLHEAVEKGRLTHEHATGLLTHKDQPVAPQIAGLLTAVNQQPRDEKGKARARQILEDLRKKNLMKGLGR